MCVSVCVLGEVVGWLKASWWASSTWPRTSTTVRRCVCVCECVRVRRGGGLAQGELVGIQHLAAYINHGKEECVLVWEWRGCSDVQRSCTHTDTHTHTLPSSSSSLASSTATPLLLLPHTSTTVIKNYHYALITHKTLLFKTLLFITHTQSLRTPPLLPHTSTTVIKNYQVGAANATHPSAPGSGGGCVLTPNAAVRMSSVPVSCKAILQRLPPRVYKRLEELVARCSYMEWKHFDAGVVKVRA